MSIINDFRDAIIDRLADFLLPQDFVARRKVLAQYRNYRAGDQERQLKVKPLQMDDNIVMNFTGLVIDRSVSMLFGKGITFNYDKDETEDYLNAVFDANRKELLLHKVGLTGSESGTWYIKIVPDGKVYNGVVYPRLVVLDPLLMSIQTAPDDIEAVVAYKITYMIQRDGKEFAFQERTFINDAGKWQIDSGIIRGDKFVVEDSVMWQYDFPPIIHGQNLPNIESAYGDPDVTSDVIELQDRLNLTSSNISKILRLHAHPILIGKGFAGGGAVDIEPGRMMNTNADQDVYAVELQSDLSSSQQYLMTMRQALFDVTRTVDISSMNDKLGALTNFGLRVLYQDALAKNETKKQLYGDGLLELNRRLLVMAGMQADEGHIEWPEPLPTNETEETASLAFDIQNKLVSTETVSGIRGYDYEMESEKLQQEAARGDNVGALLLANFTRGGAE